MTRKPLGLHYIDFHALHPRRLAAIADFMSAKKIYDGQLRKLG